MVSVVDGGSEPSRKLCDVPTLVCGALLGLAFLTAVHVALAGSYWEYSEGVYVDSSHLWLHGADLYRGLIAAQPPGVFVVGAGLLAVHDGLEWVRLALALFQLLAGLLAGQVVLRITGSRLAASVAPVLMLLTPWAVRDHGALLPELIALPLLLAGLLFSTRSEYATLCGLACGMLPVVKYSFALPAAVLVLVSPRPRRSAAVALATLAACLALATGLWGSALWRDSFVAQLDSGHRSVRAVAGYWTQAGWNLIGLVVPAAIAVTTRSALDPALLRATCWLAAASVLTLATNFKVGTSLNILVPIEACLVPLAITGMRAAFRARRVRPLAFASCVVSASLMLAQTASLLLSPTDPKPFLRPGSRPAWTVAMTRAQVHRAVASAEACPPGFAYSGPPLIAFLAHRAMPDGQPDQFIIAHSTLLARKVRPAPTCP